MRRLGRSLRPVLDGIYNFCGAVAAIFMILILVTIVAQMIARWSGTTFPGSTDYAGYFMAAASFLALAYALNHGAHIRVTLILTKMGRWRRFLETWCFGIGAATAVYFAYYSVKTTYLSHILNDVSQGQDALPLWIPQLVMAIGTSVLALSLIDHFLRVLFGGTSALGDEAAADHHTE